MERWMKILTCAGYEYMKLMVADLQRQLEELDKTKGNLQKNRTFFSFEANTSWTA